MQAPDVNNCFCFVFLETLSQVTNNDFKKVSNFLNTLFFCIWKLTGFQCVERTFENTALLNLNDANYQ